MGVAGERVEGRLMMLVLLVHDGRLQTCGWYTTRGQYFTKTDLYVSMLKSVEKRTLEDLTTQRLSGSAFYHRRERC